MNTIKIQVTALNVPIFHALAAGVIQPGAITTDIMCEGYLLLAWAKKNLVKLATKAPPYLLSFNPGEAQAVWVILPRILMPQGIEDIMRNDIIGQLAQKLTLAHRECLILRHKR